MFKGLFDLQFRLEKIDQNGDPLVALNQIVDWELFRPDLEPLRDKERKSDAGRKPYDLILMFKILILKALYNLADDRVEQQILDRLSFHRFLGLTFGDPVPDAKTIWTFQNALNEDDRAKLLFDKFDAFLRDNGFAARKGQIVDAAIVQVPKQRNTRKENKRIKNGEADAVRAEWAPAKAAQKDTDARWTKKNNKNFFGYKHHDSVDVKYKFVREYEVTPAHVHDSNEFVNLLTENTSADVYADSAYRSAWHVSLLEAMGYRGHLQRKGTRGHPLTDAEVRGNHTRAKVRARVEHVFGTQRQRMGDTVIRTIGMVRARTVIGLRHLAYNLSRYALLAGRIVC
jgi:Transposase and inactivated derivatives, IS5 family